MNASIVLSRYRSVSGWLDGRLMGWRGSLLTRARVTEHIVPECIRRVA
jgi:hypothetical protein